MEQYLGNLIKQKTFDKTSICEIGLKYLLIYRTYALASFNQKLLCGI
jgi:hypothetical protein